MAPGISTSNVIEAGVLNSCIRDPRDPSIVRLMPAAFWRSLHPQTVQAWCLLESRYGIPTLESVEWIVDELHAGNYRRVVEIGAGSGDFAYHLRACYDGEYIPTDSKIQESPQFMAEALAMGQPPVQYPDWVEKIDANAAVKKYQPDCVFASWVTQWFDPAKDIPGEAQAITYGVDELALWAEPCVKRYIMVGNMNSHGRKRLRRKAHVVWRDERDSGLISRAPSVLHDSFQSPRLPGALPSSPLTEKENYGRQRDTFPLLFPFSHIPTA